MKKLLLIASAMFVLATVNAQDAPKAEKTQTKEERQKMKEKQEADMASAFKEIGLTDDQVKLVKEAMQEASEKSKPVKSNTTLSEDEKAAQLKEISDAKNARIKEIMGEEKYKQYNAIRKKQKQADQMSTPQPAGN